MLLTKSAHVFSTIRIGSKNENDQRTLLDRTMVAVEYDYLTDLFMYLQYMNLQKSKRLVTVWISIR